MTKKEFTATEVMAILERMEKQFRVFGEAQEMLKDRVNAMFDMVGKNTEDIDLLKSLARTNTDDIKVMKLDISDIKAELVEINRKLEQKIDRAEYIRLERRVGAIERKLKIA